MPSPFVHATLPIACLVLDRKKRILDTKITLIRVVFVSIVMANICDLDLLPALIFRSHLFEIHRAWGHNIFSLVIWTWLGTYLLKWADRQKSSSCYYWIASGSLIVSHILLDAAGHFNNIGFAPSVPLFWPISSYQFTIPLKIFVTMDYAFLLSNPMELLINVFSLRFFRDLILCEILPCLVILLTWISVTKTKQVIIRALKHRSKLLTAKPITVRADARKS